jgi:hypothetical protein
MPPNHSFRRSKKTFRKDIIEKRDPPVILDGESIWQFVQKFPKVTESGTTRVAGFGSIYNWTKRSMFWDLPYWKENLLRHNLDVMHIEKNFFGNVFNTVMNVKDKSKDNVKARKDIQRECKCGDLELVPLQNGKMGMPKAKYSPMPNDAKLVCKWVKELKMAHGFASNLGRCANVNKGAMQGMKSHDCHVFMENLLPIAFPSLHDEVWKPLIKMS